MKMTFKDMVFVRFERSAPSFGQGTDAEEWPTYGPFEWIEVDHDMMTVQMPHYVESSEGWAAKLPTKVEGRDKEMLLWEAPNGLSYTSFVIGAWGRGT
jgi:hypothetical protein